MTPEITVMIGQIVLWTLAFLAGMTYGKSKGREEMRTKYQEEKNKIKEKRSKKSKQQENI